MPRKRDSLRLPSYRRHKPSGQAVVTLTGKDYYLGRWNTKASRAEYDRLIGEWLAVLHQRRRTPLSCGNRPGTNRRRRPKRQAGDRYTTGTYRRAIHRACDKAGIDRWSPNRLRHAAGMAIRKQYGLEAAQVTLGHATADVTQVYAERDLTLAAEIMRKIG